jgi:hypothetical protein
VLFRSSFFVCKLSPPRRASQSFSRAGLKQIIIDHDNEVDFDITSQYLALFGILPAVGASIHYELRIFATVSPILNNPITGIYTVIDGDL